MSSESPKPPPRFTKKGWGSKARPHIQEALQFRRDDSGITDPADIEDIERLLALISTDPDMALAKSRVILERLVTTIFRALVGPPGTRPLETLIREAGRADVLPRKVLALCEVVRELGNVGTHPVLDAEKVTHREAELAAMALLLVFEWYNREGAPFEKRRAQVRDRTLTQLRARAGFSALSADERRREIANCIWADKVYLEAEERLKLVEEILSILESGKDEAVASSGAEPPHPVERPVRRFRWWVVVGLAVAGVAAAIAFGVLR